MAVLLGLRLSRTRELRGQALVALILHTSQQLEMSQPQAKRHPQRSRPLTAGALESGVRRPDSTHLGAEPLRMAVESLCADCLSSLIFSIPGAQFTTDFKKKRSPSRYTFSV